VGKKTEEKEGKLFIGFLFVGVGAGYLASIWTDNWMYMGACTIIGLGIGFASMAFVKK
jgi:hypothetical protein